MNKENTMNLQEQGCRYYISPDKSAARWMPPAVKAAFQPDWTDVTDWTDDEVDAWLAK